MSEAELPITELTPGNETARAQLDAKISGLERDVRHLRRMLAFAYCGAELYGDDGELQDARELPWIDFVRDPIQMIEDKIHARGIRKLVASACGECRRVAPTIFGHEHGCSQGNARGEHGQR